MQGLLLAANLAAAVLMSGSQEGGWSYASTTDEMTDEVTHSYTLEAGRQGLIIQCNARQTYVIYVDLDGLGAYPSLNLIDYRFDEGPAVTTQWRYTNDSALASGPEAARVIDGLRTAGRVRIRAASILRGRASSDLDVSGVAAAVADLEARCGRAL